ncbi:TOMM precursor leader peptide-binding protein [Rhodocaloribacter sp.]
MKSWGFSLCDVDSADLSILLVATYHDARIDAVARQCAREGRPWLLFKPVGLEAWIGPFFKPGRGCLECLRASLRLQDPLASFLETRRAADAPTSYPPAYTQATLRIACHRAASELANHFLEDESAAIEDHVLTFDLTNWTSEVHGYVRRPHCPACGNPRPGNPPNLPFPSPPSLDLTRRHFDAPLSP